MIAYFLAVHKNPQQVARLMNVIYSSNDNFYINIFGADSIKKVEAWKKFLHPFNEDNVFFSYKYSLSHGTIGQVRATIDAMQYFADVHYSHFINLSGQCYPVKPIRSIKETLSKSKFSFLDYCEMPDYCSYSKNKKNYQNTEMQGFLNRFDYRYYPVPRFLVDSVRKLRNRKSDKSVFIRIPRIQKKILCSFRLYCGSNWFCLHKDHIKYILDFLKDNPDYLHFFSTVLNPDEEFFHIILLNSSLKDQIINDNLRYISWDHPTGSPVILTLNHFDNIIESQKLFARKFDTEIDTRVLDAIDLHINSTGPDSLPY